MKKYINKQKGFTLIELLVVIFIIGILAGVILPNFIGARERARDARRKSELAEIKNALRLYYNDYQSYPAGLTFKAIFTGAGGTPVYMQYVPNDPVDSYTYAYCVSGDTDGFVLCSQIENAGDNESFTSQASSRCPASICSCNCGGTRCYYVCGN